MFHVNNIARDQSLPAQGIPNRVRRPIQCKCLH